MEEKENMEKEPLNYIWKSDVYKTGMWENCRASFGISKNKDYAELEYEKAEWIGSTGSLKTKIHKYRGKAEVAEITAKIEGVLRKISRETGDEYNALLFFDEMGFYG